MSEFFLCLNVLQPNLCWTHGSHRFGVLPRSRPPPPPRLPSSAIIIANSPTATTAVVLITPSAPPRKIVQHVSPHRKKERNTLWPYGPCGAMYAHT